MHTYHFNSAKNTPLAFSKKVYQSIMHDDNSHYQMQKVATDKMPDWIKKPSWFHAINFGDGLVTSGRFAKDIPPNYTLYGVLEFIKDIDLTGMHCLDIGTMDGITAFTLKQQGAEKVIATDMEKRQNFVAGQKQLGLEIDYYPNKRIDDIAELLKTNYDDNKLDLIVNAGILYHVFEPLTTLINCREMLKTNGLLILETMYMFDEHRPVMLFNPSDNTSRGNRHANTFWRASKTSIEGMLNMAGFNVIATRAVNGRLTLLAQACPPDKVKTHYPKVKKVIGSYMRYKNYGESIDYNQMKVDKKDISKIAYKGKKTDAFIFRSIYHTELPLQPEFTTSLANRLKLLREDTLFCQRTWLAQTRADWLDNQRKKQVLDTAIDTVLMKVKKEIDNYYARKGE